MGDIPVFKIKKRNREANHVALDVAEQSRGYVSLLNSSADDLHIPSVSQFTCVDFEPPGKRNIVIEAPKLPDSVANEVQKREAADVDRVVCKDFFECGYCALGDSCHYAHYREGSQRVPAQASNWSMMRQRLAKGGTALKPLSGGVTATGSSSSGSTAPRLGSISVHPIVSKEHSDALEASASNTHPQAEREDHEAVNE